MKTANATLIACLQLVFLAAPAVMTPMNAKIRCALVQYVVCITTGINPNPADAVLDGERMRFSFRNRTEFRVAEQRQRVSSKSINIVKTDQSQDSAKWPKFQTHSRLGTASGLL
jgi:hypothetical protein